MEKKLTPVFWFLSALIALDLIELVIKYKVYDYNLLRIGLTLFLMLWMGFRLGVSKVFMLIFAALGFALLVLAYNVTWN